MDINFIIILAVLLFAIGGFATSEALLFTVWRSQEKKKSSFDSLFSNRHSQSHGTCYDECMTESRLGILVRSQCVPLCVKSDQIRDPRQIWLGIRMG